jgi:hypothetical protein
LAAEQTALLNPMAGNLYQILPGLFPYAVPAFFSLLVAIAWVIVFAKLKHIEALVVERSPVRSAEEHEKERVRPGRDDRIFHIRASSIQRDAKRHTLAINRLRHASLTPAGKREATIIASWRSKVVSRRSWFSGIQTTFRSIEILPRTTFDAKETERSASSRR